MPNDRVPKYKQRLATSQGQGGQATNQQAPDKPREAGVKKSNRGKKAE